MIIDSSAIVAILQEDEDKDTLLRCITDDAAPKVGAPTEVEVGMVLAGYLGIRGRTLLARFLEQMGIATIPFTKEHSEIALDAFRRFGKGRHPAKLNFGDCLTYATAYVAREPLLCIGDDFPHTDLKLVELG
jgi:ribonuclease VapC